jgi:hypothetical protein
VWWLASLGLAWAGAGACDLRDDGTLGVAPGEGARQGSVGGKADEAADATDGTGGDDGSGSGGGAEVKVGTVADTVSTDVAEQGDSVSDPVDSEVLRPAARCGDGVVNQANEQCDGADLAGATCAALAPERPVGEVGCGDGCVFDTSACKPAARDGDSDADTIPDARDPHPNDMRRCGDSDSDGCDDCSLLGRADAAQDGFDSNGDGRCDFELDWDCMHGTHAAGDPYRMNACIVFAYTNRDRAHFTEESGGGAPLRWNEALWVVARAHSLDMCRRGFFAHTNPDGLTPADRAEDAGVPFSPGENIAANLDPGAAQFGWMSRPTCRGHRGTILDARATEAAIGYIHCEDFESPAGFAWFEHHLVTGMFKVAWGAPKSAFCQNAANDCEIPPNPPTTAPCPPLLRSWGFCPTPSAENLSGWNCPQD